MAEDYKLPQLPYFIVFGNCLVDYSVTLETEDLLKRYNFKPNQLGEVRRKELNTMLEDIKKDKNLSVQKQLGGSALTTARILSKLGQSEVVFCGSVGNDDHGNFIKEEVQQLEIRTYLQTKAKRTGVCICYVHKEDRSCFAKIGASKLFNDEHLQENLYDIFKEKKKTFIYIEGFFIPHRIDVCSYILKKFVEPNPDVVLVINLSAPYIIKNNATHITKLVKEAGIVFGNQDELNTLAHSNGFRTAIQFITDLKRELNRPKLFVITNGNKPVEIYKLGPKSDTYKWKQYAVPQKDLNHILDTTGAGDAFAAAFMHSYMKDCSTKDCVDMAMTAAANKCRKIGTYI